MARQAIDVGFPNPNFVAETSTRQAILPGSFVAETSLISPAAAAIPFARRFLDCVDEIGEWWPNRRFGPIPATSPIAAIPFARRLWIGEDEGSDWHPNRHLGHVPVPPAPATQRPHARYLPPKDDIAEIWHPTRRFAPASAPAA